MNANRYIWIILGLISLIVFAAGFFIHPGEGKHGQEFWWSSIPVFFALFGFFGCVVLTYFAKKLINFLLHRKEDYYE